MILVVTDLYFVELAKHDGRHGIKSRNKIFIKRPVRCLTLPSFDDLATAQAMRGVLEHEVPKWVNIVTSDFFNHPTCTTCTETESFGFIFLALFAKLVLLACFLLDLKLKLERPLLAMSAAPDDRVNSCSSWRLGQSSLGESRCCRCSLENKLRRLTLHQSDQNKSHFLWYSCFSCAESHDSFGLVKVDACQCSCLCGCAPSFWDWMLSNIWWWSLTNLCVLQGAQF